MELNNYLQDGANWQARAVRNFLHQRGEII